MSQKNLVLTQEKAKIILNNKYKMSNNVINKHIDVINNVINISNN